MNSIKKLVRLTLLMLILTVQTDMQAKNFVPEAPQTAPVEHLAEPTFAQKQAIAARNALSLTGIGNRGIIDSIAQTQGINYHHDATGTKTVIATNNDGSMTQQVRLNDNTIMSRTFDTNGTEIKQTAYNAPSLDFSSSPQETVHTQVPPATTIDAASFDGWRLGDELYDVDLNSNTNNPIDQTPLPQKASKLSQAKNYLADKFASLTTTIKNIDGSTTVTNINGTKTTTYPVDTNGTIKKIIVSSDGKNATVLTTNQSKQSTTVENYSDYQQLTQSLTSSTITTDTSIEHRQYDADNPNSGTYTIQYKTGEVRTGTFAIDADRSVTYDAPTTEKLAYTEPIQFKNSKGEIKTVGYTLQTTDVQATYQSVIQFTTKQQVTSFLDGLLQSVGLLRAKEAISAKAQFLAGWRPRLNLSDFTKLWTEFTKIFTVTATNSIERSDQSQNSLSTDTTTSRDDTMQENEEGEEGFFLGSEPLSTQTQTSNLQSPNFLMNQMQEQAPQPTTVSLHDRIVASKGPLYTYDAHGKPVASTDALPIEPLAYDNKGNLVSAASIKQPIPLTTRMYNALTQKSKTSVIRDNKGNITATTVTKPNGITTTTWPIDRTDYGNNGYERVVVQNKTGNATEIMAHTTNKLQTTVNYKTYDIQNADTNFKDGNVISSIEQTAYNTTYKLYENDGSYNCQMIYTQDHFEPAGYNGNLNISYKKGDILISSSDPKKPESYIPNDGSDTYKKALNAAKNTIQVIKKSLITSN